MVNKIFIGTVIFYYKINKVGLIKIDKDIQVGDNILIEGLNTKYKQSVDSLEINIEDSIHIPIKLARAGNTVRLKLNEEVEKGDLIYKIYDCDI